MLSSRPAVAFVAVSDFDAARAFYEGVLGLEIVSQNALGVVARAGGVTVRLIQPSLRASAVYTVLGFDTPDIAADAAALAGRGVVFERYDFLGETQDVDAIWTAPDGARVAWFKDPDGNVLSLSQHPPA
ncbi:MAG: VOC family protein [Caulobacteraceae bacterium]|nr:VOC family protein [Caulobacteraceae bacterium]